MFAYWAKGDDAADLARIINNDMAEQVGKYPERFTGLGTVPMQAPELAVAEMTRCVVELGFAGGVRLHDLKNAKGQPSRANGFVEIATHPLGLRARTHLHTHTHTCRSSERT